MREVTRKRMKIIFSCLIICSSLNLKYFLFCPSIFRRLKLQSPRSYWLSLTEEERKRIIDQVLADFPRLDKNDLKTLDQLILSGQIKAEINPLTIKDAVLKIRQLDKLNEEIFKIEYKPLHIKIIFDPEWDSEVFHAHIDLNHGILKIKVPTKIEFDAQLFVKEIFFSYLHEDGHIKENLIIEENGQISMPFSNNYWFYALERGNLNSPYLEIRTYRINIRSYMNNREGIFWTPDPTGWIGRIEMLKIIHETLNTKMLFLLHGVYYRKEHLQILQREYHAITQDPEDKVYQLLHRSEMIDPLNGSLLLLSNLRRQIQASILGDQTLAQNFEEIAYKLIAKIDLPSFKKAIIIKEYQALAVDFVGLAENLHLRPELKQRLKTYLQDINNLWQSIIGKIS